jgi:hypothetical protein
MVIEKKKVKSTSKRIPKRSTRDASQLHFMFIRDAIVAFPWVKKNICKSGSKGAVKSPNSTQAEIALKNYQNTEQLEASRMVDSLVEKLEAYQALVEKIDFIAQHALTIFDRTQVGGRKPSLEVKTMAVKSATEYHMKLGKYPSAAKLCEIVRQDFFKKSPQRFIKIVGKKIDEKEVVLNSIDPKWAYWKHIDGVVSERTISNILYELRTQTSNI